MDNVFYIGIGTSFLAFCLTILFDDTKMKGKNWGCENEDLNKGLREFIFENHSKINYGF